MSAAIFLYDYTGIMAQPWLDAGYTCYCFDGQHEGHTIEGKLHKVGIMFDPLNLAKGMSFIQDTLKNEQKISFVFGFPPCDDLAGSGAAHWAEKAARNPDFQQHAMALALFVRDVGEYYKVPWGFENPVGRLSTLFRKANFYFHPNEYGGYLPKEDIHPMYPEYIPPRDAYKKKTGIWHNALFKKPDIIPVEPQPSIGQGSSDMHNKLGGKSKKTKNIRSATPRGFALAVYLKNS